jgi:hypothetical protein
LSLDVLDKVDGRTLLDSFLTSNDSVSEDTKVLSVFVEEDDNSLLIFEVGGDEDGDIGFAFLGTEGKSNLFKTELFETFSYDIADNTYIVSRLAVDLGSQNLQFIDSRWTQLWRSFLVRKNLKYAFRFSMLLISSLSLM